jgi:hypothetical protein
MSCFLYIRLLNNEADPHYIYGPPHVHHHMHYSIPPTTPHVHLSIGVSIKQAKIDLKFTSYVILVASA